MDYIKIDSRQYRVKHSYLTFAMFAELTGRGTIEQMGDLSKMTPHELLTMMYCSLYVGAKVDKVEFDFASPDELGLVVGIADMQDYVQVFAKQVKADIPAQQHVNTEEVKKKRPFWRSLKV